MSQTVGARELERFFFPQLTMMLKNEWEKKPKDKLPAVLQLQDQAVGTYHQLVLQGLHT